MELAMIQGSIVPISQVEPARLDRGIFFGDGVYETLRSYNGKIFAIEKHMARFANSLSAIKITGVDIDLIRSRVENAFAAAEISNAKIYFHITRGSAPRNHVFDETLEPNFFLTVTELPDSSEKKANGIAVSTHADLRWKRCDIKSLNLLANVLARKDAADKGCDEAILVDEAGLITEGAASTFFAIFGDTLQTAPLTANILPSITRGFVIDAARKIGVQVVEKSLTAGQPIEADELFIAVSTADIVPIVKFDDKQIGDGRPGSCTRSLIEAFRSFTV